MSAVPVSTVPADTVPAIAVPASAVPAGTGLLCAHRASVTHTIRRPRSPGASGWCRSIRSSR
jgi:hypothetical protein